MTKLDRIPTTLLILAIGLLLFVPFLGNAHLFDWDEINFAEAAREMLVTGNYSQVQINYQPFWEKPPLFIWLQALSMRYFGINEFAARLPNAITGIITLMLLYLVGKKVYHPRFGVLWVMAYIGSFLPHFYFKSGIIDPVFNLFIFLSIFFMSTLTFEEDFINKRNNRVRRFRSAAASGFFIGLAILTKGPVAMLLILLTIVLYFIMSRGMRLISIPEMFIWILAAAATTATWFGYEIYNNGIWFAEEFVRYQMRLLTTEDAGHGGPVYYHFLVLLVGCFPASLLIFNSFRRQKEDTATQNNFKKWMIAIMVVVLVVFSLVKTKILHYSSMTYFSITFLAAYFADGLINQQFRWRWFHSLPLLVLGTIWAASLMIIPVIGSRIEIIKSFIGDQNALENLNAIVYWSDWELVYGLVYLSALITSVILLHQRKTVAGLATLFVATCLMVQVSLHFFIPRIEKYTQGAVIEFYESKQEEDCYIEVLDFKSYAHLFYSRKQPYDNPKSIDKEWLLSGAVDKPTYFVTKISKARKHRRNPQLEELYNKNGFVFLKRK